MKINFFFKKKTQFLFQLYSIDKLKLIFYSINQSVKKNPLNKSVANSPKVTFDDINYDCQLLVLENLDIETLIRVSILKRSYQQLALRIFRQRYKFERVVIDLFDQNVTMESNTLHMGSELGEYTLRGFSKLIENLQIRSNSTPPSEMVNKFGNLINEYCSETLIDFDINLENKDFLNVMKKPFKRVKNLQILKMNFDESSMNLELDELFPELWSLNLTLGNELNNAAIDREFVNLINLSVNSEMSFNLSRIFKKNPQIRKLTLRQLTSTAIFETVNRLLPHLESLYIVLEPPTRNFESNEEQNEENGLNWSPIELNSDFPIVYFENVKELLIDDYRIEPKFDFKQLKSLTLILDEFGKINAIKNDWVDFIAKNSELKKIVISNVYFTDAQLQNLLNLHNLIEVWIQCDADIITQTIVDFVGNNEQLYEFTLRIKYSWLHLTHEDDLQRSKYEELTQALGRKWKITSEAEYRFNFIRNQPDLIDEDIYSAESPYEDFDECDDQTLADFKLFDLSMFQQRLIRKKSLEFLSVKHSEKIDQCLKFIDTFFNDSFAEKTIFIHSPILSYEAIETNLPEVVHIYDSRTAWNVLKSFGHLIIKLSAVFTDECSRITEHIVKYCSKSLEEFHFGTWNGTMFGNFPGPFENIRKLTIERKVIYGKFLDKMFPNIRELHLNNIETPNASFTNRKFEHLEKITAKIAPYNGSNYLNAHDIGKLIGQNTQIQHIEIKNDHIIDYLNQIRNLETLIITNYFLNEKLFNQLDLICEKFDNLKEVSLDCGPDVHVENLVKFIKKHKNLNKVQFKVYRNPVFDHFKAHFYKNNKKWIIKESIPRKYTESQLAFIHMQINNG